MKIQIHNFSFILWRFLTGKVLSFPRKLQKQFLLTVLIEFACSFCVTIIHHLHFEVQNISHSCRNTGNTCCFQVTEGILNKYISKSLFIEILNRRDYPKTYLFLIQKVTHLA